MERKHTFALRDRHTTGVRRRASAADTAQLLSASNAHVVALDTVSEAVLIANRAGVIVYANPALEQLMCLGEGRMVGRRLSFLLDAGSWSPREAMRTLRVGRAWSTKLVATRANGQTLPVDVHVQAAQTAARAGDIERPGKLLHFCITVRSAMPAQADKNSAMIDTVGRLAGEIAHDFNNQIAVVLNYTFILLRQLPEDSELKEHVRQIQASAWRASQVAQEMITFAGPRLTDPDVLDLAIVASDLQQVLSHALQGQVRMQVTHAPELWPVRARLPHIEWLLLELALHARVSLGAVERVQLETRNETVPGSPVQSVAVQGAAVRSTGREQFEARSSKLPQLVAANADSPRTARYVVIDITAFPGDAIAQRHTPMPMRSPFAGSHFPEEAAQLPGADVAVLRAQGTLKTLRQDDGSIRYIVRLPAYVAH